MTTTYRLPHAADSEVPRAVGIVVGFGGHARLAATVATVVLLVTLLFTVCLGALDLAVDAETPLIATAVAFVVTIALTWRPGRTTPLAITTAELRWRTGWVEQVVVRESGFGVFVADDGQVVVGTRSIGRTRSANELRLALAAKGWPVLNVA